MLHKKNTLIRTYIDIMNARNSSNQKVEENKTIKAVDANQFFDMI